jgi:hypothetical protein
LNFQAVSVGEKLIEKSLNPVVRGGYLDAQGMPTPGIACARITSSGPMTTSLATILVARDCVVLVGTSADRI